MRKLIAMADLFWTKTLNNCHLQTLEQDILHDDITGNYVPSRMRHSRSTLRKYCLYLVLKATSYALSVACHPALYSWFRTPQCPVMPLARVLLLRGSYSVG